MSVPISDIIALKKALKQKEKTAEILQLALAQDKAKLERCQVQAQKEIIKGKQPHRGPKPQKQRPPQMRTLQSEDHMQFLHMRPEVCIEEMKLFKKHELEIDEEIKMLKTARARVAKQLNSYGECAADLTVLSDTVRKTRHTHPEASELERVAIIEDALSRVQEFVACSSHAHHIEGRVCCAIDEEKATVHSLHATAAGLGAALDEVIALYRQRTKQVEDLNRKVQKLEAALEESLNREQELRIRLGEEE